MPMPLVTRTFEENGQTYDDVPAHIKKLSTYEAYKKRQREKELFDDPERLAPIDVDNPFQRDLKRIYRGTIGQPLDFVRAAFTSGEQTIGERMEDIRETRATELSEMKKAGEFSYRSLLYADQEEQDLIIDEDGYATGTETMAGLGLNFSSYLVGGYGVVRGLSRLALKSPKAFKDLTRKYGRTSTFLKGTSAGILTDQWISNPNADNLVSMFAEDTGVSQEELNVLGEYVTREESIAQRLKPKEDDTDFEKRFKMVVGNLPIDFVIGIAGVGKYALARRKGKSLDDFDADDKVEAVKEGLDVTRKEVIPPSTSVKLQSGKIVDDVDEFNQVINQENSFLNWRQIKQRFFTSRGYNTISSQDAFENSMNAMRKTNNQAEHTSLRLKTAINNIAKQLDDGNRDEISERVANFITDSKVSIDTLPDEIAESAQEARFLIDDLTTKIIDDSAINPEIKKTLQDNLGQYLRRSYRLFEDKNFQPSAEAREKAINYFVKQIEREKAYANATPETIKNAAEARLNTEMARAQREYSPTATGERISAPIFEARKNIPEPLREVMGEIKDPVDNLVLTVNKMSKFIQRDKFLRDIDQIGTEQKFILNEGDPRPSLGEGKEWVKIEGTQNVNLNGKYTTPLMKRVIDNQEEQLFSEGYSNNAFVKNFLSIKGYTNKAATVFNHITAIRNFLGGAQASIANGLNPFKVSGEGNVARNFSVLKNEIARGGNKRLEELHEEYLELGVINTNVRIGDFRALINEGADASSVDNLASRIQNIPLVGKPIAGLGDLAEKTYMGVDDYFKINAFEHELDFLKLAHKNSGRTTQSLKQEAAEIVKNTYFNYDRVPKGIKAMRQSPLGSFASFPAEVIRTSGHIVAQGIKEIGSGNITLMRRGAQRLAGFGGSIVAWEGVSEATATNLGWNEEQQKAAQVLTETPWSKVAPRIFMTDDKGQIHYTDTKFIDAYNTIKEPLLTLISEAEQGKVTGEEVPERILGASFVALKELASPFVSEAIFTRSLTDLYYAYRNPNGLTPDGKEIFPVEQNNLQRATNAFGYALDNLVPGSSNSIERLIEAQKGAVDPYSGLAKRELEMELLANATGTRFSRFDPKQQIEYAITNYNREERKLKTVRGDYSTSMENTVNEYSTRQFNRYKLQQELYRKIKSAQYFLTDSSLETILENRNIPKTLRNNILDGTFTPETITDSLISSVRERSVLERGTNYNDIRREFNKRYTSMTYTNLHMPEEDEN